MTREWTQPEMNAAMAVEETRGPAHPAARFTRRLLTAGLVGGHVALLGSAVAFAVIGGPVAAASAAVGSVVAILFFVIGQAVVLRFADRPGVGLLPAAVVSYGIRVAGLGAALAAYEQSGGQVLDRTATSLGLIATVLAWTTAEVVSFARMRIPVYDLAGECDMDDMATGRAEGK